MIQTKRVRYLSASVIRKFTPYSADAWKAMREIRWQFYYKSNKLWTLYHNKTPLCVIGIRPCTFLGTGAEVYMLLCEASQKHMKELVRFLRRTFKRILCIYWSLTVSVEDGFYIGENFVKFFGFRPFDKGRIIGDTRYNTFELRLSWL